MCKIHYQSPLSWLLWCVNNVSHHPLSKEIFVAAVAESRSDRLVCRYLRFLAWAPRSLRPAASRATGPEWLGLPWPIWVPGNYKTCTIPQAAVHRLKVPLDGACHRPPPARRVRGPQARFRLIPSSLSYWCHELLRPRTEPTHSQAKDENNDLSRLARVG